MISLFSELYRLSKSPMCFCSNYYYSPWFGYQSIAGLPTVLNAPFILNIGSQKGHRTSRRIVRRRMVRMEHSKNKQNSTDFQHTSRKQKYFLCVLPNSIEIWQRQLNTNGAMFLTFADIFVASDRYYAVCRVTGLEMFDYFLKDFHLSIFTHL